MLDPSRFDELHIVRKIRETIRRWWRIELAFADPAGGVVAHARGVVIPPHSRLCAASLGRAEGLARCNGSVREAVEALRLRGPGTAAALVVEQCHLGLHVIACPIWDRDRFAGALFACGFLRGEAKERRRALVLANARVEGLSVEAPDEAYDGIPAISEVDLGYLRDLLETTVEEIVAFSRTVEAQERRIAELTQALDGRRPFGGIVGRAPAMQRLLSLLERLAGSDATVLVTGENGTGKELVARGLHEAGPRRDRPFVAQNCAALNDNLLESELFGHVKGAFTGAVRDRPGLFRAADGGTLFLDEIGDTSPAMQVKLLRVLQEGVYVPVGATKPESADVRVIAATNRPLSERVARREFREDLFYRLDVIRVDVPPLRARMEDLPLLCEHFLRRYAARTGTPPKRLAPAVLARLSARDWPGNIRELENELERLAVLAGGHERIGATWLDAGGANAERSTVRPREASDLASAVAALERELIAEGLASSGWNKTQVARTLGVSRTTLLKKIKDYGIEDREDA